LHAATRVSRRLVTLAAGGRLGGTPVNGRRSGPVAVSIFLVRITHSHNSPGDVGRGTLIREVWAGSIAPQTVEPSQAQIDNGTRARGRALERCPANPIPPSPPCLAGLNSGAAPSRELRPISFKATGAVRRSRTGRWEFGLDPEAALSLSPSARLPPAADSDQLSLIGSLAIFCWSPL
jgi:hypothetical protein